MEFMLRQSYVPCLQLSEAKPAVNDAIDLDLKILQCIFLIVFFLLCLYYIPLIPILPFGDIFLVKFFSYFQAIDWENLIRARK